MNPDIDDIVRRVVARVKDELVTPEWLTPDQAATYCGLTARGLEDLRYRRVPVSLLCTAAHPLGLGLALGRRPVRPAGGAPPAGLRQRRRPSCSRRPGGALGCTPAAGILAPALGGAPAGPVRPRARPGPLAENFPWGGGARSGGLAGQLVVAPTATRRTRGCTAALDKVDRTCEEKESG